MQNQFIKTLKNIRDFESILRTEQAPLKMKSQRASKVLINELDQVYQRDEPNLISAYVTQKGSGNVSVTPITPSEHQVAAKYQS